MFRCSGELVPREGNAGETMSLSSGQVREHTGIDRKITGNTEEMPLLAGEEYTGIRTEGSILSGRHTHTGTRTHTRTHTHTYTQAHMEAHTHCAPV